MFFITLMELSRDDLRESYKDSLGNLFWVLATLRQKTDLSHKEITEISDVKRLFNEDYSY